MSISVRYLNVKNGTVNEFIVGARGVSQTWATEGNKTNRSVINGGMKHFGTMRGAGNQVEFCYAPTRHNTNGVNSWHEMTNVAAKSIAKHHFPKVFSDIQSTMKTLHKFVPDKIGGKKGLLHVGCSGEQMTQWGRGRAGKIQREITWFAEICTYLGCFAI